MTLPDRIAATIRAGMAPLTVTAKYRAATTFAVRAAAATAGATSITFNNVPAALTSALAGDTFVIGATTHTVSADVAASGGSLPAVSFTPPLAAAVTAGMQVVLSRTAEHDVSIIPEQVDGYNLQPGIYAGGDWRITVFGLPAGVEPSGSGAHKITWDGRTVIVQPQIGRDPVGAGWIVRAKAG